MIGKAIIGLGFAVLVGIGIGVHPAQAQTHGDRPSYGFACYATPGAITKATLHLRIRTTNKLITIDRACDSANPVTIQWPPIFYEDGAILSMHAEILTIVYNKPGFPRLYEFAPCYQMVQTGYLAMECMANPNEDTPSGKATFFVSIGPDHDQKVVTRP